MKKQIFDSDKILFTSDLHFGHNNIISFCDRPYSTTDEMDEALIDNWNNKVEDDSIVFVLGDIGFCSEEAITQHFSRLRGRKILIRGNHDHHFGVPTLHKLFEQVSEQALITVWDKENIIHQKIFLSHYPMISWANSFQGSWQLFGHVHSSKTEKFDDFNDRLMRNQYDVGVDNNDYAPITYDELKKCLRVHNLEKETNKR